ncbi:MAG: pyridoxal-phosphate dependent enzyme, partial [Bacteroidota bacterium]
LIDQFVKVTDKDAAIMTRKLAREEGLFIGWSCGAAVFGALEYARENLKEDDVMVVILPDHGTRYLGKVYNDNWMKDHGFIEEREFATAQDIITHKNGSSKLLTVNKSTLIGEVIKTLNQQGIDQIPVTDGNDFVGSVTTSKLLETLIEQPEIKTHQIGDVMDKPMPFVGMDNTLDVLSSMINKDNKALLVRDKSDEVHIITQHDLLMAMSN